MNWRYKGRLSRTDAVLAKTGGKCFYCGVTLPPNTDYYDNMGMVVSSARNWHIEHATPRCRGGTGDINNLVPSCSFCNFKKHAKTAEEFMRENVRI